MILFDLNIITIPLSESSLSSKYFFTLGYAHSYIL